MKRTKRCSVSHWAVGKLSFRSPKFHRQRVRKRRIPLPRQARGRDLDVIVSYAIGEQVLPAASPQLEPEINKVRCRIEFVLWVCVSLLGLIVFGGYLVRFFYEAPFAWPSINGAF